MSDIGKLVAILFCSSEPITLNALRKNLASDKTKLNKTIEQANIKLDVIGLIIIINDKKAQLVTKPEYSNMIEEFYDSTPQSLSQPALETLGVIAYKQPVSKEEIDEIRGISSEQSLKNLLNRNLVEKVTKSEQTKYDTTLEFLKLMGISSVKELEGYGNENK